MSPVWVAQPHQLLTTVLLRHRVRAHDRVRVLQGKTFRRRSCAPNNPRRLVQLGFGDR